MTAHLGKILMFLVIVGGLAAFGMYRASEVPGGPLADMQVRSGGIVLKVVESDVVTLGGMDRFRVTLEPVRGRGQLTGAEAMMALCGSLLSAKFALDERGFDRNQVFRVSIQIRHEGEDVFEGAIPMTVKDGACSPDIRRRLYLLRYPDPIADYVLDNVKQVEGEEGVYELRFNHLSDNPAVLSEFDFQAACTYIAEDRPDILADHFPFDDARQVKIIAQSGWNLGILQSYRNLGAVFNWAKGACVPVETGAPA